MAKADLHVHSCYSSRPSEWFLQRLGTRESYTTPETIYQEARSRGMDYVTITDHNEIAASMMLKERYPSTVFTGVEVTTYFPENGCKIHVLVYNLTEKQFAEINTVRSNIYDLRDYIREQGLPHSVAHATYATNNKLTLEYIERLILLFDYFEGTNGSRTRMSNETLVDALQALTPVKIEALREKHGIEPYSDTAWLKGMTGGSDDHSGLFIAKTHTEVPGGSPEEFLENLILKRSAPGGRHNDYRGLAFAIYKIAYDFSCSKSGAFSSSFFNTVNRLIFEKKSLDFKNKIILRKMKLTNRPKENVLQHLLIQLIDACQKNKNMAVEEKLAMVYEKVAHIADEFFMLFISGIEDDISRGDIIGLIKRLSASIPGIFLSVPFFTTMNVLHESRAVIKHLSQTYGSEQRRTNKKVLYFTDAQTGAEPAPTDHPALAGCKPAQLIVATCGADAGCTSTDTPGALTLPAVYSYTGSFCEQQPIAVPSMLSSLKIIYDCDPDEIVLATPGPVGLLGLLTARLLHVPCTGIYSSAFVHRMCSSSNDTEVSKLLEEYTCWFYSLSDTIGVRSPYEMRLFENRGLPAEKLISSLLPAALDPAAQNKVCTGLPAADIAAVV